MVFSTKQEASKCPDLSWYQVVHRGMHRQIKQSDDLRTDLNEDANVILLYKPLHLEWRPEQQKISHARNRQERNNTFPPLLFR
eukprot:766557-Hanusia_phi.AAC.1